MSGIDLTWPNGDKITLLIEVFQEGEAPQHPLKPGRHTFGTEKGQRFTVVITPQTLSRENP